MTSSFSWADGPFEPSWPRSWARWSTSSSSRTDFTGNMALNFNKVFTPHKANTVNLTPTTSTSRVALNEQLVGTQAIGGVRVLNNTGTIAFIKLGDSSVTATT